jgi:hypothetical protein
MLNEKITPSLDEQIKQHDSFILQYIQNSEAAHGLDHALKTADLAFEIAQEPEYSGKISIDDLVVLRDTALLHDIGYGSIKPHWSGTQEEHSTESALIALDVLRGLKFYQENPERLGQVAWLIYNHDNTNYTFPAFWLFEQTQLARSAPNVAIPRMLPGAIRNFPNLLNSKLSQNNLPHVNRIDDHLIDLLQIIQEADSRLGDAKRTLDFCDKRKVPRFSNEGGVIGVGPLWWQESAAANIILAVNRALLDAHTKNGKRTAEKIYHEGIAYIQKLYDSEMNNPSINRLESGLKSISKLHPDDIKKIFHRSRSECWENSGTSQTYFEFTRNLPGAKYDIQLNQKQNIYGIASRLVPISQIQISPTQTSDEFQNTQLFGLSDIRDEIIRHYALDIFTQLVGTANVEIFDPDPVLGDEIYPYHLQPPVIPIPDFSYIGHPPYPILSGSNWVSEAKKFGLEFMRVIFIKT